MITCFIEDVYFIHYLTWLMVFLSAFFQKKDICIENSSYFKI